MIVATGAMALGLAATPLIAAEPKKDDDDDHDEKEVLAVEDLMREHGVLRRALLVYSEASARIVAGHQDVPLDALARTAALFRTFGEDYHERALEEQHVFVPLIKAGGTNGALAKTLTSQHQRGREITDYVTAVAKKGRSAADAAFAHTLVSFVRMYQHHAAIEDTIIFPAWKRAISGDQYEDLSDEFEELEHKMFGKDGFEDALTRIASIEQAFGLTDLAAMTPPVPPKVS
jgi:hemerythrin-like domain-containing protein